MKNYICLLFVLIAYRQAFAQGKEYRIEAYLNDEKIPIKAYLYYRDGDSKFVDSTFSKNNRFVFTGKLQHAAEATMYVHWLYPKGHESNKSISEGITFMLGAGNTAIVGQRLQNAKVDGGKIQQEYLDYNLMMQAVADSVVKIWRSQLNTLPEDSVASFQRLAYARRMKARDAMRNYIRNNPESDLSFDLLRRNSIIIENTELLEEMISALRPAFGKFDQFTAIQNKLNLTKMLSLGQPAIEFEQTNDTGKVVRLSEFKGKYVLIDFWASWCGPCRTEYPFLKRAYSKYSDRNFEIIGVSLDSKKEKWIDAIQSNGFEWTQLSDLKGGENAVAKAYGIAAIPQNFLIDPDGKIVAKNLRGEELLAKIAELIK
jgi:peroxiredoxin